MEKQITIGFDIDGVLVEFNDAFLNAAKKNFNLLHNITRKDIIAYNYWDCPAVPLTKSRCFELINYVLYNPVECGVSSIDGAPEALTMLSKYTDLLFITARQDRFKQQTKELVHSLLPNVDSKKIIILHESGRKKYKILKSFGVSHFVDDKLTTCQILEQHGINTILFDSPWNQTDEKFHRTNDWNQIYKYLRKKI